MSSSLLFRIAAVFNFAVAAGLLAARDWLTPLLRLDPAAGTNALLIDLAGVLIATFGYAYWKAADDAVRYRPYVTLGVIGKLAVVLVCGAHFAVGAVSWPLPALASGDLLFALLFIQHLRSHPAAR